MVKLTPSQLPDGSSIITDTNVGIFEEDGIVYKGSIRPNAINTHYVVNEAQILSALPGGIIPAGEIHTIILDDNVSISTPLSLGLNSGLGIMSNKAFATLTYTGTGAMIRDDTVPGAFLLRINDCALIGNGTNTLFDLTMVGSSASSVLEKIGLSNFADLGDMINGGIFTTSNINLINNQAGIRFLNTAVSLNNMAVINPLVTGGTAFKFTIDDAFGRRLIISNVVQNAASNAADNLFDFDSGLPLDTTVTVTGCAINSTPTVNFYAAGSLDSTSLQVASFNNKEQANSMSIAEERLGIPFLTVEINASSVYEQIQDLLPTAGDFIQDAATERFSVNTSTGTITYLGLTPATVSITYQIIVGSNASNGVGLAINDVIQSKTEQEQSGAGTLSLTTTFFQIQPNDTLFMKIQNTQNSSDLTVNACHLTVSRQSG